MVHGFDDQRGCESVEKKDKKKGGSLRSHSSISSGAVFI